MSDHMSSGVDAGAIAIVGMAFRLPGASSREAFWANLRDGVESVAPLSEDEARAAGMDPALLRHPRMLSAAGRLPDIAAFDAPFFGYSPNEAAQTDPQQRLFLECAWEALEDAACDPARWPGAIGVFAGSRASSYAAALPRTGDATDFSRLGNGPEFLATTVSYKLDLTGPSVNVQTACSTSLVAVYLASQALFSYECDLALAGAVSIVVPQEMAYVAAENGVMSPDGHCRAFDARAAGSAPGNGVAVLALKRLDDALRERDVVHAVLRGIAVNNDGAGKIGYTAPGVRGQASAIAAALAKAGMSPADISYVETHGTGTPLGDTVEIAALTKAFASGTRRTQFCAIGSVKTNIGHTDTVAGAAGLIKTVLALRHRMLPPSLNFETANPHFDLRSGPFYVNTAAVEWPGGGTPRRAGVSSFGLGGTNAHAIVEEAPPRETAPSTAQAHVLVLSAKTPASLDAATAALADYLESPEAADIGDVAYTLQTGRKTFERRRAIVCRDAADARRALAPGSPRLWSGAGAPPARVVFAFSGVGDQYSTMGGELYRSSAVFRREIDTCAAILQPLIGRELREVMCVEKPPPPDRTRGKDGAGGDGDGRTFRHLMHRTDSAGDDRSDIHQTILSHAATFCLEYALTRVWMDLGLRPDALIGYSLGEYAAACVAGVMHLDDALRVVVERARIIEAEPPGAMLAAGIAAEDAAAWLGAGVTLGATNAPLLSVFTGTVEGIDALQRRFVEELVACRRLPVTRPLHSPLLRGAADKLADVLRGVPLRPPAIPCVSNVTGTWITDEESCSPEYWAAHTCSPVQFAEGVGVLLKTAGTAVIEIGPGQALGSCVLQHEAAAPGMVVLASVPHEHDPRGAMTFLLEQAARWWLAGGTIDWAALHRGAPRWRVALPTYRFDRQRHWIDAPTRAREDEGAAMAKQASVGQWLYTPGWKRAVREAPAAPIAGETWVVFGIAEAWCARMVARLRDRGARVITVAAEPAWPEADVRGDAAGRSDGVGVTLDHVGLDHVTLDHVPLDPGRRDGYARLVRVLAGLDGEIRRIVHCWTAAGAGTIDQERDAGIYSLIHLLQALRLPRGVEIDIVSAGAHEVIGSEPLVPERAMVLPLCRTAAQEYPNVRFRQIDLPMDGVTEAIESAVMAELSGFDAGLTVAFRGAYRWVQQFERLAASRHAPPLRRGGVYVITGGLGAIGLTLAEQLFTRYAARLVLTGRTPLPARETWPELAVNSTDPAMRRRIETLRRLEEAGCEYRVVSADVGDFAPMAAAFDAAAAEWGGVDGVIHAAGATDVRGMLPIDELTREACRTHLHPKIDGLRVLARVIEGRNVGFCVVMSSLSTVLGGLGLGAYAAANACMSEAAALAARGAQTAWLTIEWDSWDVGRDAADENAKNAALLMTPDEGWEAFSRLLTAACRRAIVSMAPLDARLSRWVGGSPDETPVVAASRRHARPALMTPFVEPRNEAERTIAALWTEVLGVTPIGIHDNFFELGGHSLFGIRLIGRVRAELGVDVRPRDVFAYPTIAQFTEALLTHLAGALVAREAAIDAHAGAGVEPAAAARGAGGR